MLIYSSTGKREKTYALLDTGSQSTLMREDFGAELKLRGNKTNIKMSSIKDQGESIIIHEVILRISSIVNNKMFKAKGAFIIPVEKFNMPSQKHLGLQHVSHLKGLTLADTRAEDIKLLIGADIPEAFHQLDIKSGDKGEPLAIKTLRHHLVGQYLGDLENGLRNKVSDEDGLSQDDKNCLACLDSMTM